MTDRCWRHTGQRVFNRTVANAVQRPMGDSWVFDRKADVDISPLVAVTLAAYVARRADTAPTPGMW